MIKIITTIVLFSFTFSSLALAEEPSVNLDALSCNGCHGTDGFSKSQGIPTIGGMDFPYFMRTMMRFRNGKRSATIMDRIAKGYSVRALREISRYYAGLRWQTADHPVDDKLVQQGKKIHDEHCEECHEKNGLHQDRDIPRLMGQAPTYLYLQMLDYQHGLRPMPQPEKMKERLEPLSKDELRALSLFYATAR